jgi:hypothetical protein
MVSVGVAAGAAAVAAYCVRHAGESGGGLSSRSFFNVRVELTEEGNGRVPEVVEVLFKYLDLVRGPGGINAQVRQGGTEGDYWRGCLAAGLVWAL